MSTDAKPNRLIRERSPYLLQHARNPVAWLPWGDEAFAKARAEDKPVFLSVGYSACHWCHVMERESFEDEALARTLNERFVPVKVDREERPDVDQVYQLAYQLLAQRAGGWPLSMFLTPDREPFFGGTYFPPAPRHGLPSFGQVLERIDAAWREQRGEVIAQAAALTRGIPEASRLTAGASAPSTAWLASAVAAALPRVDRTHGGFGSAPKFPNAMTLELLLIAAALDLDGVGVDARAALALSLAAMSRGGIRDHLGGGYARYSTDARWLIPHFEKMLYDNALLARLHLGAARLLGTFAAEGDALDAARCRAEVDAIAHWLAREMTSPEGAFFSAQDADSEGEEGRFFVWTPAQIREAVGAEDAPAVCAWFDVTDEGNFDDGRSALWTPRPLAEIASRLGMTADGLRGAVARAVPRLLAARSRRPAPLTDDKCLAGWNALVIGALADAGATLGRADLLASAERALDAWRARAWRGGRLAHAMKGGEAYGDGFLDDHAGMAGAALDVWEAGFDPRALAFARELGDAVLARFYDPDDGALYFSPSDGEVVLHRAADPFDHAHPGGVGLAVDALHRLGVITGDPRYREAAERAARRNGEGAVRHPLGMATVIRAVDRVARGDVEVIVMGDPARDDTRAMLRAARGAPIPHRVLVLARDEAEGVAAGVDPALLAHRAAGPKGAPVAFVCRGVTCEMPARTPEALLETLRRVLRGGG